MQIQTFNLWNPGEAIVEDQTSSAYTPYLVAYLQEPLRGEEERRPAILICPGGAYCFCSPREGEPIAMQYLARGYQAFVVYYSIAPSRFPAALKDAAKSVSYTHLDVYKRQEQGIRSLEEIYSQIIKEKENSHV